MHLSDFSVEVHLISGFCVAILIALVRAFYFNVPPETTRKFLDALMCGFVATLTCITAVYYDKLPADLIMPASGLAGLLGFVRVRSTIEKIYTLITTGLVDVLTHAATQKARQASHIAHSLKTEDAHYDDNHHAQNQNKAN